ncbi:serine protease inhibitor swm-1-like [Onthophagus taurus]|uniref:serine protease inhibitor swm-1-like n=1 Tax=Onthophagus taurus TaxID=166361 RepID=UPI0039BE96D9
MAKLTILFVLIVVSIACGAKICPRHQVYNACGTSCPEYCNWDPSNMPCTLECVQDCFCQKGFVLEAVDSNKCIPKGRCSAMPTCGLNKEYRICGSSCPKYCGQNDFVICTAVCVPGCFCKDGYVLASEDSNECILESECKV